MPCYSSISFFFFFNDPPPPKFSLLPLHAALPISPAGIDFCDYALLAGIDREHLAFLFAGYVHFAVYRVDGDAFRLGRYLYFAARLAGIEIDNQSEIGRAHV